MRRTDVAKSPMASGTVVIHFDVFEHGLTLILSVDELLAVDAFDFQSVAEALGHRVVVVIVGRLPGDGRCGR